MTKIGITHVVIIRTAIASINTLSAFFALSASPVTSFPIPFKNSMNLFEFEFVSSLDFSASSVTTSASSYTFVMLSSNVVSMSLETVTLAGIAIAIATAN